MAELVDALDSKSCIRKGVQVRFLFWALKKGNSEKSCLFVFKLYSLSNYRIIKLSY